MWPIVLKSGLVGIGAAAASLLVGMIVLGPVQVMTDPVALGLCVLCPLLIAWPSSAVNFRKNAQIEDAHARLSLAHGELKAAHAALAETHARLEERSRRDAMTGLLNRESFHETLDRTCTSGDGGALLIIDADHFKTINDTHGHLVGDAALVAIADAVARAVPEGCTLGRIGGEEFAACLSAADPVDAESCAEKIRDSVARIRFQAGDGTNLPLTVSIGVVDFGGSASMAQMLRLADKRLYAAKRSGRNRVVAGARLRAA